MKMHAEIEYINSTGERVHSDICPPECKIENISDGYIQFLHTCLDEWLLKSKGTGQFYIKQESTNAI